MTNEPRPHSHLAASSTLLTYGFRVLRCRMGMRAWPCSAAVVCATATSPAAGSAWPSHDLLASRDTGGAGRGGAREEGTPGSCGVAAGAVAGAATAAKAVRGGGAISAFTAAFTSMGSAGKCEGVGFRQGPRFRVQGSGHGVRGSGLFMVQGCRVQGSVLLVV